MAIPGRGILAFASRWFDAATVSRVFEPLVADWQREWSDASPAARTTIRLRGTAAFIVAAIALLPRAILLAPMPAAATRRVLSRIIIFTSVATMVQATGFLFLLRDLPWPRFAAALIFLVPSIMIAVFPFAMTWVADALRRQEPPTPVERAAALRTSLAAVAFALLFIGWVMPAANQAYREVSAPEWARPPARGARELTLGELIFNPPLRMQDGRNPNVIRREINSRIVIALLPAVLLWLRWGAHNAPRKRWISPLPVALETALAFTLFMSLYLWSVAIEPALGLKAGTAMWLPIVALIFAGVMRTMIARRVSHA